MDIQNVYYTCSYWDADHHGISTFPATIDLEGDIIAQLSRKMDLQLKDYDLLGSLIISVHLDHNHGFKEINLKELKGAD